MYAGLRVRSAMSPSIFLVRSIIVLFLGVPGVRRDNVTQELESELEVSVNPIQWWSSDTCPFSIALALGGYGSNYMLESLRSSDKPCCKKSKFADYIVHVDPGSLNKISKYSGPGCGACGEEMERYILDHNKVVLEYGGVRIDLPYTDLVEMMLFTRAVSIESKLAQHDSQRNFVGSDYVLFLYPAYDHNGAFAIRDRLCRRLKCWISRGFKIVFEVVHTMDSANSILDRFPDGSISHVVLGGHGSDVSLHWQLSDDVALIVDDPRTYHFLKRLERKMKHNATVLLDSCLNAARRTYDWILFKQQLENLFQYVARLLPHHWITASKLPLNDGMFRRFRVDNRDTTEQADDDVKEECIAGDAVKFVSNGVDVTARKQR
eukprot:TRINITY_DN7908_c0_g1_i2.p1 TRINITY_DN7908_c0_g1~~TRINITY_DN7908_c0_g1_i2.p1  ORF type:complete len:377 (+),score=32.25 TRINITY_DN7908_c0_g1_i2:97-1227(+)